MTPPRPQLSPGPSLQARALRLLARREHSRLELSRKLAPHVQEGEDLHALLDGLQAQGYISHERVAQTVARVRGARLGTARLVQELRHKGLDEDMVRETAQALRSTEHARAWAVWQRRFGAQIAQLPKERERQLRFLAMRGFAPEVACKVVRGQPPEDEALQ